jgi:hypothetical protein
MLQRLWFFKNRLPIVFWLIITPFTLLAQPLPYSSARLKQIDLLRQTLQKTYEDNYNRGLALAKLTGRPTNIRLRDGQKMTLQGVDERGNLVYYVTSSATQAGITTRTNSLYAGGSLGLDLSGSSASVQGKLGIWDGGAVRATHVELAGRVTQMDRASTTTDDEEHPSHVSGIMIASGINPLVRGMAYKANLKAWDYTSDVSEMSAAAAGLLVSNHSYGLNAGFFPNTDATSRYAWIWYGDTTVSRTYDYRFGVYESRARSWDQISVTAPNYLIVMAAGNSRSYNGPAAGQPYIMGNYTVRDSTIISTAPRDNQRDYDILPPPAAAKNILTVGSISVIPSGYYQPADVVLSNFSSWGPTDDGRIKPDIVGAGSNILSCNSTNDSAYVSLSGTSMSSPNVAGSVLLLQEYYAQLHNGAFMRSSTLRGLVLHTADEAGTTPGPDYQYGWGLLNIERAARVIGNGDKTNLLGERSLAQGQRDTIQVIASGKGPLLATICWTDPAGTVSSTLNDRTPKLVNDLDVRVNDGQTVSQPWTLDPANPANAAVPGDNIRDNIEQIRLDNAVPGKTYTIIVTHKGTLSSGKQDYALILSGVGGQAYCASAPTSSANSKITNVTFGSINQAGAAGCTTYNDFTQNIATIQAAQSVPLTIATGTCGSPNNVIVKAFADWNANGSFTDDGEIIATSGVLNGVGTFTTNVTVPQSVSVGQLVRLRIVAVETTDPAAVSACGSYGNGETQDYVLRVILISNDVGVTGLASPTSNFCPAYGVDVSVQVKNFGTQTQTNVPVSVQITDASGASVTTLTGTVPTISPAQTAVLKLLTTGLTLASGQTYRFIAATTLANDQNSANNQTSDTRTTAPAVTGGVFTAAACGSDTALFFKNTGNATAFWYDAPTGGNLLAAGNQASYNKTLANGTVYVALNELNGRVGPASKADFGGGTYSQFGPSPLITTTVPITIASARLYIGRSGRIQFRVSSLNGTVVSSVTLDVKATRTLPISASTSNGQLADDPADPGAVYPLNLTIPQAGNYQISVGYDDSVAIFRSNVNVSGFPFRLTAANGQTIISTRGSLFNNASTGKVDTLTNAWYYFYDMQIRSAGCPGAQRQAVSVTSGTVATASITPNGSTSVCQGASVTLQANTGTGLSYQWYRNGTAITGATSSTLQAATAGAYTVQVAASCQPASSSATTLTVRTAQTPTIVATANSLTTNAIGNIQWLFNGVPITGATSSTYLALQTGRYSVRGSANGCGESLSTDTYITILATEPTADNLALTVYPNPTTRQITIELTTPSLLSQAPIVRLTNLNGQSIRTAVLERAGKTYSAVMDLTGLSGGTFFVVVEDDRTQAVRVKRITKQ